MEQTKYDVFISYSRKDYVDDAGNVLPNNMLSKIRDNLKANGISYWFDEEGIYSGDEFASVLTRAIRNSSVFLFVSSKNSNSSKWTSNEISTALEFKKPIIPFRIDNSPYNDSVMMKIISFDYIECREEEKAMSKLLRAIKHHLPESGMCNQTTPNRSPWRNLEVPERAKGTIVAFNVDGEWQKHTFTSDDENNITSKKDSISQKKLSASGNSTEKEEISSNSVGLRQSSNRYLWTAIGFTLLIMSVIGVLTFCIRGHEPESKDETATILNNSNNVLCQPVDLGLTSGTMWADRNVGASTASDFGSLYAWGEIKEKEDYSIYSYVEQLKPSVKITEAKHDAAATELGVEWTLPTEEQFNELLTECQWVWKKVYNHNGYEIIGKNGNRIFLPASGWIQSSAVEYRNRYGYYWTSERSTNSQFARSLQFPKNGKGIVGNGYLYVGRSIRAVYANEAVAE